MKLETVIKIQQLALVKVKRASQVALVVKSLPANTGDKRCRFSPWVGKISWRRA